MIRRPPPDPRRSPRSRRLLASRRSRSSSPAAASSTPTPPPSWRPWPTPSAPRWPRPSPARARCRRRLVAGRRHRPGRHPGHQHAGPRGRPGAHRRLPAHRLRHRLALDLRQPRRALRQHQRQRPRRRPARRHRRHRRRQAWRWPRWPTPPSDGVASPEAWRDRVRSSTDAWAPAGRPRWTPTRCSTSPPSSGFRRRHDTDAVLTQGQIIGVLQEHARPGDVIVAAAGGPPGDLQKVWDATGGRTCHLEFGFSCMGYEIPAAMGVRMAHPDPTRRITAFLGDGTFLMAPTELVTAAQEGLPITLVVPENHGYQVIHRLQMFRSGREFGNEFRYRTEASTWAPTPPRSPGSTATTCRSTWCRSPPVSAPRRCGPDGRGAARRPRRHPRPPGHGRHRGPGDPARRPARRRRVVGRRPRRGVRDTVRPLRAEYEQGPPPSGGSDEPRHRPGATPLDDGRLRARLAAGEPTLGTFLGTASRGHGRGLRRRRVRLAAARPRARRRRRGAGPRRRPGRRRLRRPHRGPGRDRRPDPDRPGARPGRRRSHAAPAGLGRRGRRGARATCATRRGATAASPPTTGPAASASTPARWTGPTTRSSCVVQIESARGRGPGRRDRRRRRRRRAVRRPPRPQPRPRRPRRRHRPGLRGGAGHGPGGRRRHGKACGLLVNDGAAAAARPRAGLALRGDRLRLHPARRAALGDRPGRRPAPTTSRTRRPLMVGQPPTTAPPSSASA